MYMDSLEKLNCAIKLAETKKEHVEKAMLSLLVEWKNLEKPLDSSAQRLLQDCFTDIQSREARLNQAEQSVTTSNQVLDDIRSSFENRMQEVERKEKDFQKFYVERCEELGFEERRVDEKRVQVEGVFHKFCAEKRELEGIRDLIEERFEVVKLKEKSIENREVKLQVIWKNLVEREKGLEVREKESEAMRDLNEKRSEVESREESFVSKEKELEMVKKITHDLWRDFNLQKAKLDKEKKEVDEKFKELEMKEKCLKERVETIDKREKEFDAKNVMSKERCRGVEIREKKFEDRLKEFELKEKRLKESVEAMDLKKKEIELKCVSSEEICRGVEIREKKLQDQLKEFELKEKHFKEWVGSMNLKEKEIDLKNALSEERCRKLQVREKKLDDQIKEFEQTEKHFRERVKTIEMKKKEVESGRILNEERCKKLDLMEKTHQKLLTEFKLKEQQFGDRVKSFEDKEKEVDSIQMSCEERCRKFELEKEKEFELKEKHFKEWVNTIDLKEKEIDSVWILNEERCKKLDSMEKNLQELLIGLKMEQHENRVKSVEAKEKEVDSVRISSEERFRKFELEKKKLEDQMKDLEVKKKQFSNVNHSIVKPEPCSADGSYADIRFSITMGGKNLLLYLINRRRDLDSMTDEVCRALRMSMNPGKLVLDAMQDFYLIIEDKEFEGDVVCKSSIFLLEQLRIISPQIPQHLKKAAMELAHEWENKMKSLGEVSVFLNLLASYGLGTAFDPEEFLSVFEVIGQHSQISELCQLLGYAEKISDLIQVMLKKQQHVKAIRYVCAFGLRDKFQPASLLKDFMKNAEEASSTLLENGSCPVDKKDEAIDNILASLREAIVCIFQYKLQSEYSPVFVRRFIKQLIRQKKDKNVRLSASNNDLAIQEAEKKCKSATVVLDPTEDLRNALVTILSDMDGMSLLLFLSENPEDHEFLGSDILTVLRLSREPAKLVLYAIRAPHLEMGGKNYESPVIMRSCILLLEQLMNLSTEIKQQVKEDAMKLAFDWKTRMRTPVQVLGFLHLVYTYGLNSRFVASELERHFDSISHVEHSSRLCQVSQSSDKRPNQTTTSCICDWHQNDSSGLEMSKKEDKITSFIHSANLAKLVLDAIQSCYNSNLNGKRSVKSVVVESFIVLLEKLLTISPQILPHVKNKAAKFAVDWNTQLLDVSTRIPVEVFAYFYLLAVYKVAPSVDSDELLGLLESIYMRRRVPQLVRLLGLAHKIPDFVESLIQKGHRLQAIRYIYEFELVGKFLPVPILKDHLSSKKLLDASHVPKGNIAIVSEQLAILREVVKCIKDHQLEAEYPLDDLLAQVQKLEELAKEFAERSQSCNHFQNKHVSGPYYSPQMHTKFKRKQQAAGQYPGREAQTHWHMNKHPRIEPPVGTSFNVPSPAFNSVSNFVRCEGAYMQYGPQAQRPWHINQHPQTVPPGTSFVRPPPFHSVTNFPDEPPVGTSFNVPSPAFNSVSNFVRCEGAYMQYGPQAQRPWHINQHPQTVPPGTSSVRPPPPFHPVTNFPNEPLVFNPQNALQS